jgi:subtilisin family serine protease
MRRVFASAICAVAIIVGALGPACAQSPEGEIPAAMQVGGNKIVSSLPFTPLSGYVAGAVFVAAAAPIIGTIVLGREMTESEVWHTTLSAFLGPVGWLLADRMYPPGLGGPPARPPTGGQPGQGGNISIPTLGDISFVPNEILLEFFAGASPQQIARMENQLQLALLETQSFILTGRTLRRYRIDSGNSVRAVLLALRRFGFVNAAQPNHYFLGSQQVQTPAPPQTDATQYVVSKLNLLQAHRVSNGDDVLVAVIDSQIDTRHPDLVGAFAGEEDLLGKPDTPHAHGTAMAGAIAAHSKLIGVAPKVRVLAIRAFSGGQASAQGTTFNILKALDFAASRNARVVNMSFAGPYDPMLRVMLASAYRRGMVLIAAVGNAGRRSPPLYPAADPHVIGVTATDANDKLLPLANRGSQVTVAAPGVEILADAPDGTYQVTSGTSIAAAHASGVAALLLARDPKLTPAGVRRALIRSARKIPGRRREIGAGVIDAFAAVNEFARTQ